MNNLDTLLSVDELSVGFYKGKKENRVLDHISFKLTNGEILGIVGESGSGKTMTSLAVMGLLPKTARIISGSIHFQGKNLLAMKDKELRSIKGSEISMVFQEPMTSFNPLLTIGAQVEEMLRLHSKHRKEEYKALTLEALQEVGLSEPEEIYHKYPHQLSGGMRQRAMLAMAMIAGPKLIIADEPTTALDVTTQSKILQLLKRINEKHGTSIILISHDLRVIKTICGRVIVMKDGKIEETGRVKNVFEQPQSAYTRQFITAIPLLYTEAGVSHNEALPVTSEEDKSATTEGKPLTAYNKKNNKDKNAVLQIQNLFVSYTDKGSSFVSKKKTRQIVKNVSVEVKQGETLGIVGESGSGKTTLAKAIVGLNRETEGVININSLVISGKEESVPRPQMVFQDPYESLNPMKKVRWILEEALKLQTRLSKKERLARVNEMIKQVGLDLKYLDRYPSQLSGGQRQRVAIAAALIASPGLVILDEPVSSLDVTIQAQILELLKKLQKKFNLTYVFVSHDLNVVYQICDRVCVIYKGEIVEQNEVKELFHRPQHEYTKELLKAAMLQ